MTGQMLLEEALRGVEDASDDWDRSVIDRAIWEVALSGSPFSANDVRPLLPAVRPALVGARFRTAATKGLIRRVGYVKSTDPGTHCHPVALWVRVT